MSHQDYSSKNEGPGLKDVRLIYVNIMFLIYKSHCGDCIFCKLFPLSECKVQLFSNSYDPTVVNTGWKLHSCTGWKVHSISVENCTAYQRVL